MSVREALDCMSTARDLFLPAPVPEAAFGDCNDCTAMAPDVNLGSAGNIRGNGGFGKETLVREGGDGRLSVNAELT